MTNTHTPTAHAEANGGSPTTGENVHVHFVDEGATRLSRWTWGKWSPVTTTDKVTAWNPTSVTFFESESMRRIEQKHVQVTFHFKNGDALEFDLWGMSRMDLVRALLAE